MDHFAYRDGVLCAEDVPLARIAGAVGTPAYVYASATIERHYGVFAEAFAGVEATVCYAVKANGNLAVVRTLADLGAGADVVSGGELTLALAAGVPAGRIVFSGVGKTAGEIATALRAGVMQINVESEPELDLVAETARGLGVQAPVAFRVNPDVDAGTHHKISTGRGEDKFGIEWAAARAVAARAAAMPGIDVVGVAVHIGSQLTDLGPFRAAFQRLRDLVGTLRADGHDIRTVDAGGGLGIPYGGDLTPPPSPAEYADAVKAAFGDLGCRVLLEPGRVLMGNAGVLLTRVVRVKEGATRTFVVVDAAMNDLLRPTLYGAHHDLVPVTRPADGAETHEVDVVGPICETGDTFARGCALPPVADGDLLVFRTAGAYSAAMASTYNARPLVPEVMVRGDAFAVVRERMAIDDLLALQRLPEWLDDGTGPARRAAGGRP